MSSYDVTASMGLLHEVRFKAREEPVVQVLEEPCAQKAARDLGEYTGASLKKLASIVSKELKVNWE